MRVPFLPAFLLAALAASLPALAAPGDDDAPKELKPKATLDDRADPSMRDNVGKAGREGRKDTMAGAYINDKHRADVQAWYAAHPGSASSVQWKIGEKLPSHAGAAAVPEAVLGKLPKAPPGTRYVQLGSDVLLIASGSHMVVDGVSAK
ncbi:hypothetical protein HHL11_14505 [Ramlibacter sp. G-1-2-2]|uniref:RcnB family protein n=1 Tax=Ramlibacter agri TaxID=2728837 RepID=A0A848H1V7_9BURK|nr:hypothetical protein [Ramlibacter agri]NML44966.1 hypothetical protein [Ramlibacter agri]